MFHYFTDENLSARDGMSGTISMRTWLYFHLLSLLNLIPLIGFFVWLGVYFYLGMSSSTAPSLSNFIKLQLIVSAIVLGIVVVVCLAAFGFMAAVI